MIYYTGLKGVYTQELGHDWRASRHKGCQNSWYVYIFLNSLNKLFGLVFQENRHKLHEVKMMAPGYLCILELGEETGSVESFLRLRLLFQQIIICQNKFNVWLLSISLIVRLRTWVFAAIVSVHRICHKNEPIVFFPQIAL